MTNVERNFTINTEVSKTLFQYIPKQSVYFKVCKDVLQ